LLQCQRGLYFGKQPYLTRLDIMAAMAMVELAMSHYADLFCLKPNTASADKPTFNLV